MELSIGFSTCPNDTFIFYALVNGRIDTRGISFRPILADVEELNRLALKSEPDISKVSFHALGYLLDRYCLLESGGALGRGCGPLLVAKQRRAVEEFRGKRVAIPGLYTTAYLLMRLYDQALAKDTTVMPFFEIMRSTQRGDVDAGLIIHEGRFTYPMYGLEEIIDLGRWWEGLTGLPIPLGGIVARRKLGQEVLRVIDGLIRESIEYACQHGDDVMPYIKRHAQEMDEGVIRQHIGLYVNEFSLGLGREGRKAVEYLMEMARQKGLVPPLKNPIFCNP